MVVFLSQSGSYLAYSVGFCCALSAGEPDAQVIWDQ
jgi:hypothetical protein